jgi:hypothetical protein
MTLTQIIEALPLQVYIRRGELVIHFSTPADLVSRLAETSAAVSDLDRQADAARVDGRADRPGRRGTSRAAGISAGRSAGDTELFSPTESDPPAHSG